MRLKRVRVRNFRSIRDATLELSSQTALIGGNGTGKSSFLRAIDRFYAASSNLERDDFFDHDATEPVDIELTFSEFSDLELELFSTRIHNGEMVVARVFGINRSSGAYYGSAQRHERFDQIRGLDQATPKRAAYSELRSQGGKYGSLGAVSSASQVDAQLDAWEAQNPGELTLGRDDGRFFGFTNVARGALQRSTNFVFIPAVREASADSVDAKNSVIGRLLELVVRSAILQRREIKEWQARVADEFRALTSAERLPELGGLADNLTSNLRQLYDDSAVGLAWREAADFTIPLPNADVSLSHEGFPGPVDRQGHGLQRAFILTLLRHLAQISSEVQDTTSSAETETNGESLTARLAARVPSLILAIEEPELYQHPTKQRHFAKVLAALSDGRLPGTIAKTQIIFASHSPLFVSLGRFHQVALARREPLEGFGVKQCVLRSSTLDSVAARLEAALGRPPGSFTGATLAPRLHILGPELAEGFFAACVVLVEGIDDRAALVATAEMLDIDFEAKGIAVLYAGGKSNLDRPTAIFLELGIPVYVIWDCDDGKGEEQNKALPRLIEPTTTYEGEPQTRVSATMASFEKNLETTLKEEIGAECFEAAFKEACERYDVVTKADAIKSPAVMSLTLRLASEKAGRSNTLEAIVRAIDDLRG